MNPKPFWPLNHFTVPVVIFFSKAHTRRFRVLVTQNKFYSSMSMEKEPAGAFNKAQRLNEQPQRIPHPRYLQGLAEFNGPEPGGRYRTCAIRRSSFAPGELLW